MKTFKLLILLLVTTGCCSASNNLETLLQQLDKTILNKEIYYSQKQELIAKLEKQLASCTDNTKRFLLLDDIYKKYRDFDMDSALSIANKKLELSETMKNSSDKAEAQLNRAEILSITGMYKECLDILDNTAIDKTLKPYSYHLYHSTYVLLSDYSVSEKEKKKYEALSLQYTDSLLAANKPTDLAYDLVRCLQLSHAGEYDKALTILFGRLKQASTDLHTQAIINHDIADIYRLKGNVDEQAKYLTISAIKDVESAVKEFVSLRKLAVLLFQQGDVDRAFEYIKYSMEASTASNSRLRTFQNAQTLPIIIESYEVKLKQKQNRLIYSLVAISMLVLILSFTLIYIRKQNKKLVIAQSLLDQINKELQQLNLDLNRTNNQLSESAKVKEEYIGYVFNMCSVYIDKLEDFRIKANRKLRENKAEELLKITNSSNLIEEELKEFFHSFDTVFLTLYPDFVEQFNQLLIENKRIIVKKGDLLSPEMRIFALVRLGITDSTKIATFLHYSPQTVYNYRLKIRNNALVSKEEFADLVSGIGTAE